MTSRGVPKGNFLEYQFVYEATLKRRFGVQRCPILGFDFPVENVTISIVDGGEFRVPPLVVGADSCSLKTAVNLSVGKCRNAKGRVHVELPSTKGSLNFGLKVLMWGLIFASIGLDLLTKPSRKFNSGPGSGVRPTRSALEVALTVGGSDLRVGIRDLARRGFCTLRKVDGVEVVSDVKICPAPAVDRLLSREILHLVGTSAGTQTGVPTLIAWFQRRRFARWLSTYLEKDFPGLAHHGEEEVGLVFLRFWVVCYTTLSFPVTVWAHPLGIPLWFAVAAMQLVPSVWRWEAGQWLVAALKVSAIAAVVGFVVGIPACLGDAIALAACLAYATPAAISIRLALCGWGDAHMILLGHVTRYVKANLAEARANPDSEVGLLAQALGSLAP